MAPESASHGVLALNLVSSPGAGKTALLEATAELLDDGLRIGVFVCDCGLNIAGAVDTEAVTEYARTLDDVVCVVRNKYTCADPGQNEIRTAVADHRLNRVVVASCTPRTHEPLFQDAIRAGGLNPALFEMANIRNQCSWVHSDDWNGATEKSMDLVRGAVALALRGPNGAPLPPGTITVFVSITGEFTVHVIDEYSGLALPGEMEEKVAELMGE